MTVEVKRLPILLEPDASRVITRFFGPGEEKRVRDIIGRLLAIPEATVVTLLAQLEENFRPIHANIDDTFRAHYATVKHHIADPDAASDARQRFIGACFTMEYAIESAALFNPSMVQAVDQSNVPPGSVRFLMSLRATGEGHISSIVFRRGLIDADGNVSVDSPGQRSRPARPATPNQFDKQDFVRQLQALDAWTPHAQYTLDRLGDQFTRAELSAAIDDIRKQATVTGDLEQSNDALLDLTQANYQIPLAPETDISEAVIFPYSENERHGIEDLRLVRFTDDDGSERLYGTYTAYDGSRMFPQLLEYAFGENVEIHLLTGGARRTRAWPCFHARSGAATP